MEFERIKVAVVAILSTLGELETGAPESILYMGACGGDIDHWHATRSLLEKSGLIEVKGHYVTLTGKGMAAATIVNAQLGK